MKTRIRILAALVLLTLIIAFCQMARVMALGEDPTGVDTVETVDTQANDPRPVTKDDFKVMRLGAPTSLEERQAFFESEKERIEKEIDAAHITRDPSRILDDGSYLYLALDDIKAHLDLWFTDYEIKIMTLIVMAEDWIAQSKTIWAAHVWCILDRVGCKGFVHNESIYDVLSDTTQFPTWTEENLSKEPKAVVEEIVRDVCARFIYEQMGAPEELVGRVLPADVHFFNTDGVSKYNRFYRDWHWTDEYNPFDSPFNPYDS